MSRRLHGILLGTTTRTHRSIPPHLISRAWFCSGRFRNQTHMESHASCEEVVGDSELLVKKLAAICNAGPAKLQVIADFDGTLTKYRVNGCRGQSSHGLLQQENPEYDKKRQELYEHYHPLEFSPTIPIEEKTRLMEEWWTKTHGLLIEGGLTYDGIRQSVAYSTIAVVELFEFLEERDIAVLIFSAGLADIIEDVLRQKIHRLFKNVKIVSNRMVFNNNGHLVSFQGKLNWIIQSPIPVESTSHLHMLYYRTARALASITS